MKKVFTLLLSVILCTTSPVLAMDPPPEIQQEVPLSSRKTLKIKAHPAYQKKELLPVEAYTEGPSSSPLVIHTNPLDDEFLAMLEKAIESNNHPIGLTLED